jgi:uncharacterized Zn ribbon protein
VGPEGYDFVLNETSAQSWKSKVKEIQDQDNHAKDVNRVELIPAVGRGVVVCRDHVKGWGDNIRSGQHEKSSVSR